MQVSSNIVDYLDKEIPFAMHVAEGHGHGNVYRITRYATDPDHFVLCPDGDCNLAAVVHKNDPRYKFFNVGKLRKPKKRRYFVITRKDGARKEFYRAYDALQSCVIDPHVHTVFQVCVSDSIDRILGDMKQKGLEQTTYYASLDNLSIYARSNEEDLFEFWMEHEGVCGEHYFIAIDTWEDNAYLSALKYMANKYDWKVEEVERYEFEE